MNNDFESILRRLRQGVGSGVSTIEGTFAGDILQAVAAELARIWSQEIDTVTQRGFVATAEGEWLDAACADLGMTRKSGESDERLRARALAALRQSAASGNEADYVAWTVSVEGVSDAMAVPLARGNGTVDVYYIPEGEGSTALQAQVADYLEGVRPVGADVTVREAQAVTVNVNAAVSRDGSRSAADIRGQLEERLRQYFARVRLTEQGRQIGVNRVIGLLMQCDGVSDVDGVTVNGQSGSLPIPVGSYAVLGSVVLTEAANG
ncbi:MAG: baseplate J/gp47 family protein [Clostridia bacterium]|nr:baseplate J/gp47 family protein [Clostridia bacterium]